MRHEYRIPRLSDPGPVRLRTRITRELDARLKYIASKLVDEEGKPMPHSALARRFIADGVTRKITEV